MLINAGIFQAGWIASVLFGNPAAVITIIVSLSVYALYFSRGIPDYVLIFSVILLGWLGDTMLGVSGVLQFASGSYFPPLWMITLWLLFASSLPWSLRWIVGNLPLFAVFASVAGPFSYFIGIRLSDVSLGVSDTHAVGIFFAMWLVHGIVIHFIYRLWSRNLATQ